MKQPRHRPHAGHSTVLLPGMANRHGLMTGATGTGKTVTLKNWRSLHRKSVFRVYGRCEGD
ncbi:helicase HerA-like domain-containing protein [Escherichia coli]